MANKINEADLDKKTPYSSIGIWGIIITIIGVVFLWKGIQVEKYYIDDIVDKTKMNQGDIGQYGEYIVAIAGAIFSIVGIIFIVLTFKQQGDAFRLERFESQFFEMMKIYRENVNEMYHTPSSQFDNTTVNGRKVFVEINREFQTLYNKINLHFGSKYQDSRELISIVNLTIFFGLSKDGITSLQHCFEKYSYSTKFSDLTNYILNIASRERSKYDKRIKFHGGHQSRLGHHFRHLFQTVLFVHKKDFLTRQEKYDYIKILRGQMSNYEQAVFFYNSLSPFGMVWELKYRDIDYNFIINKETGLKSEINGKEVGMEDLLITEYRLIKNIPIGFTGTIDPKKYYKNLPFEGDNEA